MIIINKEEGDKIEVSVYHLGKLVFLNDETYRKSKPCVVVDGVNYGIDVTPLNEESAMSIAVRHLYDEEYITFALKGTVIEL